MSGYNGARTVVFVNNIRQKQDSGHSGLPEPKPPHIVSNRDVLNTMNSLTAQLKTE